MMRFWLPLWVCLVVGVMPAGAGEYDFTIPEAEPSPFEFGGRLESRYVHHRLNENSVRNRLQYALRDPGAFTHEWRALTELSGAYRRGMVQAAVLTHHEFAHTHEEDEWIHKIYEAYASLTPTPHLTLEAGKKRVLWGKGYAWNPAGFINGPKDPDDPALNLEGHSLLGVDVIKSFAEGDLTNVGLTALLLPVIDDWANPRMGRKGDLNGAVKLYLLWHDTDLDFIYFDGPEQPRSLGFDFARNLAENIEVHGELAFRQDVPRTVLDAAGRGRQTREDALSFLLGVRYLNAMDTTFIVEYYHNGEGYDRDELDDFFTFQRTALERWEATANPAVAQGAVGITGPIYQQRNLGRDYVYVKVSQKEPWDILYFTPWMAAVVNLQDFSFNMQPGMTWAPITNLELNFRVGIPVGPADTEFGEKPDAVRPEIWVRYYF